MMVQRGKTPRVPGTIATTGVVPSSRFFSSALVLQKADKEGVAND